MYLCRRAGLVCVWAGEVVGTPRRHLLANKITPLDFLGQFSYLKKHMKFIAKCDLFNIISQIFY